MRVARFLRVFGRSALGSNKCARAPSLHAGAAGPRPAFGFAPVGLAVCPLLLQFHPLNLPSFDPPSPPPSADEPGDGVRPGLRSPGTEGGRERGRGFFGGLLCLFDFDALRRPPLPGLPPPPPPLPQTDLWSCGVILFILLAGAVPFRGNSKQEIFESIVKKRPDFSGKIWRTISPAALDLLDCMLQKDPHKRWNGAPLCAHGSHRPKD